MPYGRSNTSEVIPPRGSIGSQDSTTAVAGNFSRGVGIPLGFAEYVFEYALGAVSSFTFGVNGDGNIGAATAAKALSAVGDNIHLAFTSTPDASLFIPAGWMWWASVSVNLPTAAPFTVPDGELFAVTRMDGSIEYMPMAGAETAAFGFSGPNGQALPLFAATTVKGTLFTVNSLTLRMMGISQVATPGAVIVSAV